MQLQDLEDFFNSVELPETAKLNAGERIVNVRAFVHSHLTVLKAHGDKPVFGVFFDRLVKLKEILTNE